MNCAGEIFTARLTSVGQPAAAAQACRSTHSPIGTIRPVSSAIGMKSAGEINAALGMMPADKRLAAGDLTGFDVDDRLVIDLELAVDDGLAKLEFEFAARLDTGVHGDFEEAVAAAAIGLGAIEGEIRILHDDVRRVAVGGRQRDADADADDDLSTVEIVRRADDLDETRRHGGDVFRLGLRHLDDGEFVTAQAGDDVFIADAGAHPPGSRLQQEIADRMTERVIDILEVVEIEAEHRHQFRTPQMSENLPPSSRRRRRGSAARSTHRDAPDA